MGCNVECLSTYGCGSPTQPLPGAVYGPYVKLRFGANGEVTVGNRSAPGNNNAIIKSFEYGFEVGGTGLGMNVEILDSGGTLYKQIVMALNKTVHLALGDLKKTTAEFGWIIENCGGSYRLEKNPNTLFFLPNHIQTQFENGVVKIKFEGTSMVNRWADSRVVKNFGTEDNKITLKKALRQLFTERDPKVDLVCFRAKDSDDCDSLCFRNSDGGCEGPLSVWPADQQNAPAIARKWLSSVTTEENLGIILAYDNKIPAIVLKENPATTSCCVGTVGTYIVNGGNCSPVLSFNPTVHWPVGLKPAAGAATPGASAGKADDFVAPTQIDIERVGTQSGPPIQQHEWMWRNPDQHTSRTAYAYSAHSEATAPYEALPGTEAELKIHGDPQFDDPISLIGKWVSIIVINPFHISGDGCTWLARPVCNDVLSNKKWLILSVNHQINVGSFVTTFRVKLCNPNIDVDAGDTMGGKGCGTVAFDNSDSGAPTL